MHCIGPPAMNIQQAAEDIRDLVHHDELLGSRVVLVQGADYFKQLDPQDGGSSLDHGQEPGDQATHRQLDGQLGRSSDDLAQGVQQLRDGLNGSTGT